MAFKNDITTLTDTLATLYTVPSLKEAVIHAIYVTPVVSSTTVDIKAGPSGSTGYIAKNVPLVDGGTLYLPKPVNLAASEIIEAKCAVSSDAEIFLSILEVDA